jgi:hypothetical protein
VFTWQLCMYGVRAQTMGQTTTTMQVPWFPFLYLAALGMLLTTIVFFMKLLLSLNTLLRRK